MEKIEGPSHAQYPTWVSRVEEIGSRQVELVNQRLKEGWKLLGVFPFTDSQTTGRFEDFRYVLGR